MSAVGERKNDRIKVKSSPGKIQVLSFAVPLQQGAASMPSPTEPMVVVGTITCLSTSSSMVWFGWGMADSTSDPSDNVVMVGTGIPSTLGPLVVAMPQTKYKGAFSNTNASSLLISTDNEEDSMLATQTSTRLTQKLRRPIFVSCCLNGGISVQLQQGIHPGVDDPSTMSHRAAALAEREVARILKEKWS